VKGKRSAIFRNAQWEVTKSGIASRRTRAPCCFLIDAELLLATETFGARQLYDWPPHVASKPWVEPDLFIEAFRVAIDAHEGRYPGRVDQERLQASFDEALRVSGQRAGPHL
jgi:hypothetical protein